MNEIIRLLASDIDEEYQRIVSDMAIGKFREGDKYCEMVGYLAGIRFVEEKINSASSRINNRRKDAINENGS